MTKNEKRILLGILFLATISLFLLSLKGRYQYGTAGQYQHPLSHDTWTGTIYVGGTSVVLNGGDSKANEQPSVSENPLNKYMPKEAQK